MEEERALVAFAALSQETRLRIVRLLVKAGPDGMAAGAIGDEIGGATTSRLSFHLTHLEHAGGQLLRRGAERSGPPLRRAKIADPQHAAEEPVAQPT